MASASEFCSWPISTSRDRIARIVDQANALRPDIILIAGDFVGHKRLATSKPGFAAAVEPLRQLGAPLGIFAVLGNHDHWRGENEARGAIRYVGIRLLANDAAQAGPLALGGVDDAFTGNDDVARTTAAMDRLTGAKILISHSPYIMPQVPNTIGLILAGHTHCSQVSLPCWVRSLPCHASENAMPAASSTRTTRPSSSPPESVPASPDPVRRAARHVADNRGGETLRSPSKRAYRNSTARFLLA